MTEEPEQERRYFCVTCDAGPWGISEKTSDGQRIYQFHIELGHEVEPFKKEKHEKEKQGFPGNVRIPTNDDEWKEREELIKKEREEIDKNQLEELLDNGRGGFTEKTACEVIVRLLIKVRKEISKPKIQKRLYKWASFYKYELKHNDIDGIIEMVWSEDGMLEVIRDLAFEHGRNKTVMLFDRTQIDEVAYWIMGRYYVKRIDLTGDLLFWNDKIYDVHAEALIRRSCRKIFTSSLNRDLTEVMRLIEDVCDLITWVDVESSIHLKVLENGTYNLKTGEFIEDFFPENIVLNQIPHHYKIDEPFADIDNVLSSIITDKKDKESFEDFLSICFHPYNGIYFQFGGVGPPGTGKSQLAELAIMVHGRNNVKNAAIHQIAEDQTTQKAVGYSTLNIDADLSGESIQHLDVIKKWVTQDNFTTRGIYEQPVDFRPMSRLLFFANELYEMANPDDAEAIYERTHLIKIENKFRGSQTEVKSIMKQTVTQDQLNGYVTYLLHNATKIWKEQKIRHPMPFQTVEDNWNLFGNRIKEFIKKYCVFDVKERAEADDPYDKWLSFAMEKGYHNKDKKKFRKIFDELVGSSPTVSRIDGVQMRVYHGFRIKNRKEVEVEEQGIMPEVKSDKNENETKPKKSWRQHDDDE